MNVADSAIAFARAQIGKPYQWGATGPNSYDCSGLVYASYKQAGLTLGRVTYSQILNGREVSKSELAPGDLVFPDPGHVQIYTGGGNIVEAPRSGTTVIERQMWGFWRARRVTDPGTNTPNIPSGGTVQTVGNPLSDAYGYIVAMFDVFRKLSLMAAWMSNPSNWMRMGVGLLGAILILMGVLKLENIQGAVSKIAPALKGATKNASAA